MGSILSEGLGVLVFLQDQEVLEELVELSLPENQDEQEVMVVQVA